MPKEHRRFDGRVETIPHNGDTVRWIEQEDTFQVQSQEYATYCGWKASG